MYREPAGRSTAAPSSAVAGRRQRQRQRQRQRPSRPRAHHPCALMPSSQLHHCRRHRGPALVCRSWAQLVCMPQLLASQALQFSGTGRRLRLFAAWVAQRAAGHVSRLELAISSRAGEEDEDDENQEEAVATAAACAVACCAAGGLEHLELVAEEAWLRLGGWAATLRGLRQLEVTTWGMNYLDMKAPLAGLTTLEDLYLCECAAAASLPAWGPARMPAWLSSTAAACAAQGSPGLSSAAPAAANCQRAAAQLQNTANTPRPCCRHAAVGAPLCIMPEEGASLPTSLTKLRLSTTASEQPPLDLTPVSSLRCRESWCRVVQVAHLGILLGSTSNVTCFRDLSGSLPPSPSFPCPAAVPPAQAAPPLHQRR